MKPATKTKEPPAITFLPWVIVQEPLTIGKLRLLPFEKEKKPGDLPFATQADIDGVLRAYSDRPKKGIKQATLLEYGDWQTGMSASDHADDIFRAREALAFSALTERKLFSSGHRYCCFHTYSICIQRYSPGKPGAFSFATSRRDGAASQIWSSEHFAFHRPLHVDHARISVNEAFLSAVLEIPADATHFWESIREFNAANTDSPDVPRHVELVMMKSAFEWLFQIGQKADDFVAALQDALRPFPQIGDATAGLAKRWQEKRKSPIQPLEGWAWEFCDIRGAAAHGKQRNAPRFVWNAHAHLAFTAILFPLMLKIQMANQGRYTLSDDDKTRLTLLQQYVLSDPFGTHDDDSEDRHPWAEIETEVLTAGLGRILYGTVD